MAVSSHEQKLVGIQTQIKRNQEDLKDFLSDLNSWGDEMKEKEESMKKEKSNEPQQLPPVRNSLDKKKLKKKRKKRPENKPKKISGSDFRAWDKFDVDKALEEIDGEGKKSSSEYETDEEWEAERKKHLANEEKDTGNKHLAAGALEAAVECYTRGMALDPTNALLPANRALVFIKMERFGAAEVDCTSAIALDPLYVKAYLRRAAARAGLQRLAVALEDYRRVLDLEPGNKHAKAEIDRLHKEVQREMKDSRPPTTSLHTPQSSQVKAVYKAPEQRSKKPLRRIKIEEIGIKDDTEQRAAIAKVKAQQSSVKKALEEQDFKLFEKFTVGASGDSSHTTYGDDVINIDKKELSRSANADQDLKKKVTIQEIQSQDDASVSSPRMVDSDKTEASKTLSGKSRLKSEKLPSPRDDSGSMSLSPREPPKSAFQFQADFQVLRNDLPAFYQYFKRINPDVYPTLFGRSLEAPVLLTILEAFRTCCIPAGEDCFPQLQRLSEVQRFSMVVLFFSSKEKQGICELFQFLKTSGKHPDSEVDALRKKYQV